MNWTLAHDQIAGAEYHLFITPPASEPDAPLTTLRNARGEADPRRVRNVAIGLCLAALAVSSAILFVAGAHQNAQITALKTNGVQVVETVSGCLGQLGGSGSNAAGYSCTGTLSLHGRVYNDPVPGNSFYAPGTKVRIVVDSADPALVSTVSSVKNERASASIFILPSILLAMLLGIGALIGFRIRSSRGQARTPASSAEIAVQKAASSPA